MSEPAKPIEEPLSEERIQEIVDYAIGRKPIDAAQMLRDVAIAKERRTALPPIALLLAGHVRALLVAMSKSITDNWSRAQREAIEGMKDGFAQRLAETEAECGRLADAIRTHRSQKADDRCIEDDDRLYAALGDGIPCDRRVGDKDAMLANCRRFIELRCDGGGWKSYADLEAERDRLARTVIAAELVYAERDRLSLALDERIELLTKVLEERDRLRGLLEAMEVHFRHSMSALPDGLRERITAELAKGG